MSTHLRRPTLLTSLTLILSLGLLLTVGLSGRKVFADLIAPGTQCTTGSTGGPYGDRSLDCTYFMDEAQPQTLSFSYAWPGGYWNEGASPVATHDNSTDFIAWMTAGIFGCGGPYNPTVVCPGNLQATATVSGDAFIVDAMLGKAGADFGVSGPTDPATTENALITGIDYAQSHFNQWATMVDSYANNGQINWEDYLTAAQVSNLPGGLENDGVTPCPTGYSDTGIVNEAFLGSDANTYDNTSCADHFYIVFKDSLGNDLFRIDRFCGNVTGDIHSAQEQTAMFHLTPNSPKPTLDNPAAPTTATFTSTITSSGTLPNSNITVIPNYYYYLGSSPTKHPIPGAPGNAVGVLSGTGLVYNNTTAALPLGVSLKAGDRVCASTGVTPSTGTIDAGNGNLLASPAPGVEVDSTEQCTEVASQPYVSFYGSDINAGAIFASGGTCVGAYPLSPITTFTNAAGQGSGEQLAAFATGVISSFNTDNVATSPGATAPRAFANTAVPYGKFVSGSCIHDYWGDRVTTPVFSSLIPGSDGNYAATSATTTIAGGTVGIGKHVTIYASGSVNITGNITYGSANPSWGSTADIPSLYIVANGDITIAPGVTQLDGVYVAQGHTIYTCGTPPIDDTTIYNNCGNQLTVNGAFLANEVKLSRTFGTVSNATAGENLSATATTHPCDGVAAASAKVCAAEVFNFGPEVYLSHVCNTTCTTYNPINFPYEYQTILPPIL